MEIRKDTVRKISIEKQGFGPWKKSVTKDDVYQMVDMLGCVQIFNIKVVERAHYLTLWSRLGCYDKELLHELAYMDCLLFEHQSHAASYIPLNDYIYFVRSMNIRRRKMEENSGNGRKAT